MPAVRHSARATGPIRSRRLDRLQSDLKPRLNPIRCVAHGLCAELLPERVTLDDWGYPIVDGSPLRPELVVHARRAANLCPTLALALERARR